MWGGALRIYSADKMTITDSAFTYNQAESAGAMSLVYVNGGSIIKSSSIQYNTATDNSGAIYYEGNDLTIEDDVVIKGNNAGTGINGIYCHRDFPKPALPSNGFDDNFSDSCH